MSTQGWSRLPMLPLQKILQNLKLEDALAATSTCQNWRNAIYLYEGHRDVLKLRTKDHHKNMFLTLLFRKTTRRLHLYLDSSNEDIEDLLQLIISKFNDFGMLYEIVFIGSGYADIGTNKLIIELPSLLTDELINGNRCNLWTLAFLGCQMKPMIEECSNHSEMNESNQNGLTTLINNMVQDNGLMSRCNLQTMPYLSLHHLCMDYDVLDADVLASITNLPVLSFLTVNILNRKTHKLEQLPWQILGYYRPVFVALNLIGLPSSMFDDIIENVLIEGLPLFAIRILFCKVLHYQLLDHLACNFKNTLREVQWIDAQDRNRTPQSRAESYYDRSSCNLHPLIMLCWQCNLLQRLVVHGYWIWQYDLLGMARLRYNSIRELQVSAVHTRGVASEDHMRPVHRGEREVALDKLFVQQMNEFLSFNWCPIRKWGDLHPALGPNGTAKDRSNYILKEILKSPVPILDVT